MPPTDRALGNGKRFEPGRNRRNNGIKRHIRRTEDVEVQVEDDRTGMSVETLKRAFADNLYYLIAKDEYWANLQNLKSRERELASLF
jgi:starch phosphorylase